MILEKSEFFERVSKLSPKRLAILATELQSKLEVNERRQKEPIAVIGIGCRFPGGVSTPEAYWELLCNGVDAIMEVPASRWDIDAYYHPNPPLPGKMTTRWGGFIDGVDQFDPQFFGISPREAISMDPQQRLLLEVVWEALEHAGQPPDKLSESHTGVFIGLTSSDYYHLQLDAGRANFDPHLASGSSQSIAAGRIAYVLGLQGPCMTLDTACSSSLVAVHLAVQSLRNGESHIALAGGANVILMPEATITLSRANMMAADGRCKAFDARADGFVRSEGCGIIVLKRLSDAISHGDNILAIIKGMAINQDGRSNGLTAPNGPSQESVIKAALKDAGLDAFQIGYVETHGTGTSLGDPIEVQALGAVLTQGRAKDNELVIGSVKTNLGHLESAAGVAGLIKAILSVHHGLIPPHLHLQDRNPYIPWENIPITIPSELIRWPSDKGERFAGVSSFGFSGTNAHIIVGKAPLLEPIKSTKDRPQHLLALSAKNEGALDELIAKYASHDLTENASLADLCFTANSGRAHFNHRIAAIVDSPENLKADFIALSHGEKPRNLITPQVKVSNSSEIAFLFTGQGAQFMNMGRQLYDNSPTFREVIDECNGILETVLDLPLLSILYPETGGPTVIDQTAYTQPAMFAIQIALARLWISWGIEPAVVVGHSVGEYAAACVAGALSLEDGLKLVAERGRMMDQLPPGGIMASVFASETQVSAKLAPYRDRVSIAAINGPENIVVSGEATTVTTLLEHLKEEGIRSRKLNVSLASHSPLTEPMLDAFEEAAAAVDFHPTKIDFVSTVSGKLAEDGALNSPTYWRRHVRSTVRFAEAMHTLQEAGYEMFIEIGPDPTLLALGKRIFSQHAGLWLPSLRDGRDEWRQMLDSLAKLYVHGAEVDWEGFDKDYPRQRIHNPTYPFQRERFWFKPAKGQSAGGVFSGEKGPHPLVGWKLRAAASKDTIFETHLSIELFPYLGDHQIFEYWIVPSPVYIEMVLSAAFTVSGDRNQCIENMEVHKAMFLSRDEDHVVQLVLKEQGQERRRFEVYGLEGKEWVLFVSGTIRPGQSNEASVRPDALADFKARINTEVNVSNYYKQMGQFGLNFGPLFRGIQSMWRAEGQALGLIRVPDPLVEDASAYAWIHPAVLDTCFHLIGVALANDSEDITDAYLLLGIDQLQFYKRPGREFWSHVRLDPTLTGAKPQSAGQIISADIRLYDQDGQIIAEILGFHLKRARQETLLSLTPHQIDDLLYEVAWMPKDRMSDGTIGVPKGYLQTGPSIRKNVEPHVKHLAEQYKLDLYKSFLPRLDELCFYHIVRSFEEMGWNFQVGEVLSVETLAARLGVDKQYHRLLSRMLEILHEEGIVTPSQHAWEVMVKPNLSTSKEDWRELIDQFPVFKTQVNLTQRCVQSLPSVLRGDQDPLQLLFPGGSFADLEMLYQDSPASQMYNSLIRDVIINALDGYPVDQPLRIAEIGAGTGGTTSFLLPELPRERTQYYFTDISQLFLAKAREKFTEYPFIHYQYLDIEQSPASQGFQSQGFDLVLAANVIHATQNLRQSLGHIQELLAPGGLLVLLEGIGSHRWVDLTFGLTEGWWRFTDTDVRPTYPLLSEEKWEYLLHETGFEEIAVISEDQQDSGNFSKQAVIVATKPQTRLDGIEFPEEKESWLIVSNDDGHSAQLAELVNASGDQSILVTPGDDFETKENRHYQIDLYAPENHRRLFQEINRNQEGPVSNIIHLLSPDSKPSGELTLQELEHRVELGCRSALYLVQATLKAELSRTPRLWLVTQQAQSINLDETSTDVSQSALWGLGRTIATEHPEIWGGLVDIESNGSMEIAAAIYDEISKSDGENQVALRGDQRFIARLVRYPENAPLKEPITFRKDNTYLITGGLGGIGLQVIQWMVDRGARYLVLVGRSEPSPEAEQVLNRLKSKDAQVTYLRADISIEPDVIQVLGKISQSMPPLAGIIHAAGIFDDRVLLRHN